MFDDAFHCLSLVVGRLPAHGCWLGFVKDRHRCTSDRSALMSGVKSAEEIERAHRRIIASKLQAG